MSKIAELLAKKKAAAAAKEKVEVETVEDNEVEEEEEEKPAPKKITLKSNKKVEEPEEAEVEEDDEEEKPAPKKVIGKKAAKVEEPEDEDEPSDEDEVEEEEEEEEKPAPKKAAGKLIKKPAKVEEPEEDEEEEEEEKPAPKKVIGKKAAKVEEEEDDEEEDEPKAKLNIKKPVKKDAPSSSGKKLLFQKAAKVAKEAKEVEVGGWMPREIWLEKLYQHLGSEEVHGGKFAMPNITTLDTLVKTIEKFLTEDILPDYSISLLGTKMRRVDMPDRIYAPTTGLERVSTKYHTFVPSHTKTTLTLTFGKTSIKGDIVNDNFVEGKFEGNKFIKGKWGVDDEGNETFTPATPKKK